MSTDAAEESSSHDIAPPRRTFSLGKRRRTIHHVQKLQRPRWVLHLQATFWRVLMELGMFFHRLAPPRPPKPDFSRVIPSTISGRPGTFTLHFYVPKDYGVQRKLWMDKLNPDDDDSSSEGAAVNRRHSTLSNLSSTIRRRSITKRWGGYPVVINFHGGGFTLGHATDDARWCATVVDELNAVVVAVDYRLAPECPFPTAVEDGVDAVLWVHKHADELGIDTDKIALSGFSSGGNMTFTVPLRLHDEMTGFRREENDLDIIDEGEETPSEPAAQFRHPFHSPPSTQSVSSESTKVPQDGNTIIQTSESKQNLLPPQTKQDPAVISESPLAPISIKCIVPWYPSLDYTRTREERRATCSRADQELPALFTDLFDDSYLHPPKNISLSSPYLSPGVAPTSLLREAIPSDIIMHTCEWDMLLAEGQAFRDRLTSPALAKNVIYNMIPGVPHGWDKAPNPLKPTPGVREHYLRACKEMRRILGQTALPEHITSAGPSAAPRNSVQVVR